MMLLSLVFLQVALAVAPTHADERAIIAAAVGPRAAIEGRTNTLWDEYSPLSILMEKPGPWPWSNSRTFRSFPDNLPFLISDELVDSLRKRNRTSISLKALVKSRTKGQPRLLVSRPGISRDGQRALIVIVDHGGGGGFSYMEKRDGQWQLVGLGPMWAY